MTDASGSLPHSPSSSASEDRQKQHYAEIAKGYHAHYFDLWSRRYREDFVHGALLGKENWQGKWVLEAMCGPGSVSGVLRDLGATVIGLDLSHDACLAYSQHWKLPVVVASILNPGLKLKSFDAIVILGGLHHLHPHLDAGLDVLASLLKPGGSLRFFEPHATAWVDKMRRHWYRHDSLFEPDEAAIHFTELMRNHGHQFEKEAMVYGGSIGYLFVLNSMVWRMPLVVKNAISPVLLWLERVLQPLQSETRSFFVIGSWRRKVG
jgi:SAM-dependent methyltransferase